MNWKLEKQKKYKLRVRKRRNKGTNKQQQPDSGTHNTSAHCPRVYQVSTFKASQFLRKVWQKSLMFWNCRERKIKIKGWVSSSRLILVYTIHLLTVHVCAKFQPSRPHSFWVWEKCDENFKCLKIGEKKWRNKGTNKQQQPEYGIHNTSVHCPRVCQVSIF